MKRYPPYCIHFYQNKVTDFPICSPNFDTVQQALGYAATHYLDCKYVRLGYWSGPKYPDRYFFMDDIDVQSKLF